MKTKKSGMNYVAYLAALEVKESNEEINKKFLKSFLKSYTNGVLLDEETYNKFYTLVSKELELN